MLGHPLHSTLFTVVLLLGACSSERITGQLVPVNDAGAPQEDAAVVIQDASPSVDAAKPDASGSDILGTLSGSCGEVRAELVSVSPSVKVDSLTFVTGELYSKAFLSPGGDTLFDTPNAGGSSTESEVMSFEVLHACEGASLLKTETEVKYAPPQAGQPNSITDLLVEIAGQKVGVSVTRAYKPSNQGPQSDAELKALLEKKLEGINVSSQRVLPEDKWVKQILHVFAASQASVDSALRVLPTISAATRANTIVVLTKTTGGGFIYCNPDPPLGQECP
jgi:hypothetical protein